MAEKRRRMEAEESSDEESEGEEAAESVREQEGIEEDSEDEDVEQQRPEEESEQEEAADQARLSPHPLTAIRRVSPVAAVPPYHRGMAAAPSYCKPADVDHEGPTRSAPVQPPKPASGLNLYANDGSFLELFKKKMEQTSAGSSSPSEPRKVEEKSAQDEKRKPISFVGKRRGGARLALKTGMVAKKPKTEEEEVMSNKGGAWAQYMAEVKKYKAHQCSDDDKTRPLVK